MNENKFVIQAYKTWQLARLYKVSIDTLRRWISLMPEEKKEELDLHRNAKYFTPKQVRIITEHLGEPSTD